MIKHLTKALDSFWDSPFWEGDPIRGLCLLVIVGSAFLLFMIGAVLAYRP